MSKQPVLTKEEIEQHLRPAGNVDVLDKIGDPPAAVGGGATTGLRVDGNGQAPYLIPDKRVPRTGRWFLASGEWDELGKEPPFSPAEARSVLAGLIQEGGRHE